MIVNCWRGAAGAAIAAVTILTKSTSCADRFNVGYVEHQKDILRDAKHHAET